MRLFYNPLLEFSRVVFLFAATQYILNILLEHLFLLACYMLLYYDTLALFQE